MRTVSAKQAGPLLGWFVPQYAARGASLDSAFGDAIGHLGGVVTAYRHPDCPAFVLLGEALFATVEPVASDLFVHRLAKYPAGGAEQIERGLLGQGYVEMGRDETR